MSIWEKFRHAAAELAKGGSLGALAGGLADHFGIGRHRDESDKQSDIEFTIGVIALGAKMAKADGRVTRDEISAFREVFQIPDQEQDNVARIFNLAKRDVAGFEIYAQKLGRHLADNDQLLENVLEGLFHIAAADGVLHPNEDGYLERVAFEFGFSESRYRRVRARFVDEHERDPYEILGISPQADDRELKSHYRKLVVENHPDRAVARGLPEEFVEIATKKLAAINEAYDRICQERGGG